MKLRHEPAIFIGLLDFWKVRALSLVRDMIAVV